MFYLSLWFNFNLYPIYKFNSLFLKCQSTCTDELVTIEGYA